MLVLAYNCKIHPFCEKGYQLTMEKDILRTKIFSLKDSRCKLKKSSKKSTREQLIISPLGVTVGVRESPEGVQDVLYRSGVTQAKPEGTHWEKMESKLSHVTVGLRGIMGIMHDGTVIVHRGMLIIDWVSYSFSF